MIGINQSAGTLAAHLTLLLGGVPVRFWGPILVRQLLLHPLFKGLTATHLFGRVAEAFSGRPVVRGNVSLIEHVLHASVYQGLLRLELVKLLRLVRDCFIEFGVHVPILPRLHPTGSRIAGQGIGRYSAAVVHLDESSPASTGRHVRYASGARGNYDIILALFCSFLLISNVGATKLIQFGPDWQVAGFPLLPIITDGGAFLFPMTYIFGDVLAEVYGLAKAKRAILTGFSVSILASLIFLVVDSAPPATDWPNQSAWHAVLGFVPRIVLASLLGYLAGQFLNAWALVKIKAVTAEGSLWTRLLGSTVVGELADTAIFCTVAFAGIITGGTLLNYILVGYLYKVAVEVVLLPITYQVIRLVKKHEPDYL